MRSGNRIFIEIFGGRFALPDGAGYGFSKILSKINK